MSFFRRVLGANRTPSPFATELGAYARLRKRGLLPDLIIDVGAYEGAWTRATLTVWPGTPTLMIEPQRAKEDFLVAVCNDLPNVQFQRALLTSKAGSEVTFYEMETGSSIYPENSNARRHELKMTTATLDCLTRKLVGDNIFLKIDVQGAELDVLKGGEEVLRRTAAIQLEVPITHYNIGAKKFADVILFMSKQGFAPIELSNQTRINDVLVQIDLVFVKKESIMFEEAINFNV